MKLSWWSVVALLPAFAMAQQGGGSAAPEPNAACKYVLNAAAQNRENEAVKIEQQAEIAAKKAKEASSCLSRAGDSIVRAAIPPSIGQVLGILTDPGGYIQNATSNAACNIVTNQAYKVARVPQDINGAILRTGQGAQQIFTGTVDGSLGGGGISYGQYSGQPTAQDQSFFQSITCRIFGRC